MKSPKFLKAVAIATLAAGLSLSHAAANAQALRLGTATEGGVWFVLGNGLAQVVGEALDTRVMPVTTAGSMENGRRLSAGGDLDLGLMLSTSLTNGIEDGTIDTDKIRVIGAGHGNFLQVVVRSDSGISSWSEAFQPGRIVGVGEPGSAAFEVTTGAIEAQGQSLDRIQQARLGHQAQADALKNRDIEVMVVTPGIPTGAVVSVMSTIDAKLLPGTDAELDKLLEAQPFMARGLIPANVYNNQPENAATVMLPSLMMASAQISDDEAYKATKAIYESTAKLTAVHSNGSQWTKDNALASRKYLEALGVKYHSGAIRYFQEIGIW